VALITIAVWQPVSPRPCTIMLHFNMWLTVMIWNVGVIVAAVVRLVLG
jgi:hypothetical protein